MISRLKQALEEEENTEKAENAENAEEDKTEDVEEDMETESSVQGKADVIDVEDDVTELEKAKEEGLKLLEEDEKEGLKDCAPIELDELR